MEGANNITKNEPRQSKKKMALPVLKVSNVEDCGSNLSSILNKVRETSPFARSGDNPEQFAKRLECIRRFREKNTSGNQYKRKMHLSSVFKSSEVSSSELKLRESLSIRDQQLSHNNVDAPATSELGAKLTGFIDPQQSVRQMSVPAQKLLAKLELSRKRNNLLNSLQRKPRDNHPSFKDVSERIVSNNCKVVENSDLGSVRENKNMHPLSMKGRSFPLKSSVSSHIQNSMVSDSKLNFYQVKKAYVKPPLNSRPNSVHLTSLNPSDHLPLLSITSLEPSFKARRQLFNQGSDPPFKSVREVKKAGNKLPLISRPVTVQQTNFNHSQRLPSRKVSYLEPSYPNKNTVQKIHDPPYKICMSELKKAYEKQPLITRPATVQQTSFRHTDSSPLRKISSPGQSYVARRYLHKICVDPLFQCCSPPNRVPSTDIISPIINGKKPVNLQKQESQYSYVSKENSSIY